MNDAQMLSTFLGWCTVINFGVLVFASIMMMLMKDFMSRIHSTLTGVSQADLPALYLQYLGNYKIAIIIFNAVPYIALKVMF